MPRAFAVLLAVPIVTGCNVTTTSIAKPAHFAVWGPSARVQAYAAKIRARDPSLGVKLSVMAKDVSRADLDLVRGGSIADYPALAGGAGLNMTFTTASGSMTVKFNNLLGIILPDAKS